ncbi:MAG: DUF2157 domain-containing protein [Pseudomonadota bacterium]
MDMTEASPTELRLSNRQIETIGLVLAGAFVGYGLILWIAANWTDFDRFTRFAIVGSALAGSGALAALSSSLRVPASHVGVLAIGGLMAVVGQEYQSTQSSKFTECFKKFEKPLLSENPAPALLQ